MDEFDILTESVYTIELLADLAGVEPPVIIEYCEVGILRPRQGAPERVFDADALRILRRAEHLRAACGANLSGVRMMLEMMDEIERLRVELRRRML
jgi:MerR family transcriptional regulator/heat shock protein HspR